MRARIFQFGEDRPKLLLWLFAGFSLLFLLGMEQLSPGAEQPFVRMMRDIWRSGNFFQPVQETGQETPLWFLWSGAILRKISPEALTTFFLRLPSVLAALIALAVSLRLARQIYDRQTSLVAGWMIAGSCVFLIIGRMGVPLMTATAVSMLTVGLFFLVRRSVCGRRFYGFWLFFFCGAWSGGLSTQCAVLLFLVPFCSIRRVRRNLLSWHQIPAFLLGAAVYFVPLVLANLPGGNAADWRQLLQHEMARDFAQSTPLRTPSADLWFYSLLPFFALQIAALWAAVFHWRKLNRMTRLWGMGLLFTAAYWFILPEEGAAPALLLPCGAVFFSAVLVSPAFAPFRSTVLGWTRILAIVSSAALFCSLFFCAAGPALIRLELLSPSAFRAAGCGLVGLLVMLADEWRPGLWENLCGMPRDLAAQILCFALLTSGMLCWVVPQLPKYNP